MISSSDIACSFPFAPDEGEYEHSPRPALLNFCEIIHLCRGTVMTIAGYDRHLKWISACRAFRARVLAVANRMRDLPPRQHVKLATELRQALSDLADG
jgi:hypothetical protein